MAGGALPRADRILLGGAEGEGLKFLYSGRTYEEDDRSQLVTKAVALSESYRESSIRLEVSYVEKMGYTERIKILRKQRLGSFGDYPHNVFFYSEYTVGHFIPRRKNELHIESSLTSEELTIISKTYIRFQHREGTYITEYMSIRDFHVLL